MLVHIVFPLTLPKLRKPSIWTAPGSVWVSGMSWNWVFRLDSSYLIPIYWLIMSFFRIPVLCKVVGFNLVYNFQIIENGVLDRENAFEAVHTWPGGQDASTHHCSLSYLQIRLNLQGEPNRRVQGHISTIPMDSSPVHYPLDKILISSLDYLNLNVLLPT